MLHPGDAHALVEGVTQLFLDTIRPALQVIKPRPDLRKVAGLYALVTKRGDILNFGSTPHPLTEKVQREVKLVQEADPKLMVDGEIMTDAVVVQGIMEETYPFSTLHGQRADIPGPFFGEHVLQVALVDWRSTEDRADFDGEVEAGPWAATRLRGRRDYYHHGNRGRGCTGNGSCHGRGFAAYFQPKPRSSQQ
jgi:Phosphate acetyl/butaryl transferase